MSKGFSLNYVLIFVALVIIGGGAYFLGTKSNFQQSSRKEAQVTTTPTPSPSLTPKESDQPIPLPERPTAGDVNPSRTIAQITDAFAKKPLSLGLDLGAFLVKNNLSVIIFASECCAQMSPKEAGDQMDSYFKDVSGSWNCKDTNPISIKIAAKSSQYSYLKDDFFCTNSDGHAAGFHLNDEFLIDRIVLISDYNFLLNN